MLAVIGREHRIQRGVAPQLDGDGPQLVRVIQEQQAPGRGRPAALLDAMLVDLPEHGHVAEDLEVEQEDALRRQRLLERHARRELAPQLLVRQGQALRQRGDGLDVDGADALDRLSGELVVVLPALGQLGQLDALEEVEDVHEAVPRLAEHGHVQLDGRERLRDDDLIAAIHEAPVELVLRERPRLGDLERAGQAGGGLRGTPGVHLPTRLDQLLTGRQLPLVLDLLWQPRDAIEDLRGRPAQHPAVVREEPQLPRGGDRHRVEEPVAPDAAPCIGEPEQEQVAQVVGLDGVRIHRPGLEVVVKALVQQV